MTLTVAHSAPFNVTVQPSGRSFTADAGEAILAAGIDRYLTKPLRKTAIEGELVEHTPRDARPPVARAEHAA